ncbi:hypothetical protein [Niabella drilacis]|uniref:Uncharacterized protein n=1 Tax=Niabella drilacis (strain DSM 25811 / CCM 8410 / CCUG 62505 / LMG 26954 / E90) TaxID=1285928 RepID=A0A1G6YG02_NIADE|nr:hypothetical protein [Niabella drilacis]SDD89298.1 hypothetical protein SAMN04487894_115109 [Niabella drilacis]
MKKRTINQLLAVTVFLTGTGVLPGCDHAQVMMVQATGENNSSIVLYGNREMTGGRSAGDPGKIVVRTPQQDTTSRKFYFGMGNWSDAALDRLAGNIDSIVITNSNGVERLNEKEALKTYLRAHCKGWAHSELLLEAK